MNVRPLVGHERHFDNVRQQAETEGGCPFAVGGLRNYQPYKGMLGLIPQAVCSTRLHDNAKRRQMIHNLCRS